MFLKSKGIVTAEVIRDKQYWERGCSISTSFSVQCLLYSILAHAWWASPSIQKKGNDQRITQINKIFTGKRWNTKRLTVFAGVCSSQGESWCSGGRASPSHDNRHTEFTYGFHHNCYQLQCGILCLTTHIIFNITAALKKVLSIWVDIKRATKSLQKINIYLVSLNLQPTKYRKSGAETLTNS